ncbi:MAG: DNA polymerase III subunit beta, partial [Desulfovibrio sp.]|nr:DNA polymerase III subunit beta [Desulfovibrio sp.]
MKVAINTEHCINGILKASSITPTKSGAAMLRTMWIRAEKDKGTISFMSTDASTEYIGSYPADVEEDGLIGVQSKSITELLRSLPKGVIRMYTDDKGNNLVITQGSRTFKLPVSNLDWFQNFSEFPEDNSIVWSGEVLIGIIDRILFCVSDEEDSPLGCLYIRPKDNGEIDFCGLDGNKFA